MLLINECVCIFAVFRCETQLKFTVCDVKADTALGFQISACTKDVLSYQLVKWNSQPGMTSQCTMVFWQQHVVHFFPFEKWTSKVPWKKHTISMRLDREQLGTLPKSFASHICCLNLCVNLMLLISLKCGLWKIFWKLYCLYIHTVYVCVYMHFFSPIQWKSMGSNISLAFPLKQYFGNPLFRCSTLDILLTIINIATMCQLILPTRTRTRT